MLGEFKPNRQNVLANSFCLLDTSPIKYLATLNRRLIMAKFDKSMQLLLDLVAAQARLQKRVDQHLFIHGLSLSEFMVMRCLSLAAERSLRRIDLAEQVGLTASGITRLIAPMEKNRLVVKEANARDARVSLVKLTDVGAQILSDASASFKMAAQSVFENVTQADLDTITSTLSRLK